MFVMSVGYCIKQLLHKTRYFAKKRLRYTLIYIDVGESHTAVGFQSCFENVYRNMI